MPEDPTLSPGCVGVAASNIHTKANMKRVRFLPVRFIFVEIRGRRGSFLSLFPITEANLNSLSTNAILYASVSEDSALHAPLFHPP